MDLNPEQSAVVHHGTGPLRVVALAGSGKTSALVERVAHLVEYRRVSPSDILMITFSRTAREEMGKRLDKRLPGARAGKCARTFHSIGLMVYRAESKNRDDFAIDTTGRLFSRACSMACQAAGLESKRAILSRFSGLVKNRLLGGDPVAQRLGRVDPNMIRLADQVAREVPSAGLDGDALLELFFKVETIRTHTGVFDNGANHRFVTFDDMIYEAANLLRHKDVRENWARRWTHVMQDEAQDVNAAQGAIAEAFVSTHRNYSICGDPSQAIFSFRGTTPESILGFEGRFPGAKTVLMHRNYRSGIEICALASRILNNMPADSVVCDEFGEAAEMYSERQTHAFVACHRFTSPVDEADAIADNIIAHRASQLPWEEQAILVRMNRMTRDIEIALATREIPYRLGSGASFFTMVEAETLLGYLRVIAGRATPETVASSLRHPSRKLRRAFIEEAIALREPGEEWTTALRRAAEEKGKPHEKRSVEEWARFAEAERVSLSAAPGSVCELLRHKLQLDEYFGSEREDAEDSRSKDNLTDVVRFARDFATVEDLLDTIERVEAHRKRVGSKRKAVLVSTIHGGKGREWGVVYAPCLLNGLLPAAQGEVPEERRIFYVACTRAKDELWLSWAPSERRRRPDEPPPSRSPFLDEVEIPDEVEYRPGRKVDDLRVGAQLQLI